MSLFPLAGKQGMWGVQGPGLLLFCCAEGCGPHLRTPGDLWAV